LSKYTTEVRFICETLTGLDESAGLTNVNKVIADARPLLFNFEYPIFDANYKEELETKILYHYYTREIAHESVSLWRLKLQTKLTEIMPYYNQLYKSALLEFNPLRDVDFTRINKTDTEESQDKYSNGTDTHSESGNSHKVNDLTNTDSGSLSENETIYNTGTVKNEGSGTISGNNKTEGSVSDTGNSVKDGLNETKINSTINKTADENLMDAFSDTPQGGLTNINNYTYLTTARKNDNTREEEQKEVADNKLTTTETVDNSNTTNTDMTETNNETNSNTNTQTNNLENKRNTSNTSDNVNRQTGDVTVTTGANKTINTHETSNNTIAGKEDFFESISGKTGGITYSEMLNKFRTTFLNIDMMVISDLKELFFTLW
jgi:hypothetical protein